MVPEKKTIHIWPLVNKRKKKDGVIFKVVFENNVFEFLRKILKFKYNRYISLSSLLQ